MRLLNRTEYLLLKYLAQGFEYEEAAQKCFIAKSTAKLYMTQIYKKFNIKKKKRLNAILLWFKYYKGIDIKEIADNDKYMKIKPYKWEEG